MSRLGRTVQSTVRRIRRAVAAIRPSASKQEGNSPGAFRLAVYGTPGLTPDHSAFRSGSSLRNTVFHDDLGFHRVGDEAGMVGLIVNLRSSSGVGSSRRRTDLGLKVTLVMAILPVGSFPRIPTALSW